MLQALNHLSGPLPDLLQYVCVSRVLGSPALDTALQAWPRQSRAVGKEHLPWPAGNALPNTAQDAAGLVCFKGTLLARGQFVVHQHSQVFARLLSSQTAAEVYVGAWGYSSPDVGPHISFH